MAGTHESPQAALRSALERNALDGVIAALQAGADPDGPPDDCGDSPMRLAVHSTHPDSLEMLRAMLRHGARPDGQREGLLCMVPVFEAAASGQTEKLEVLLDAGADVDGRDPEDDESALIAAARFGHVEVAKLLVARGIDVSHRDGTVGETALEVALCRPESREIVDLLRDRPGASPALEAAGGNVEVAKIFIEECLDEAGRRFPLHELWSDVDVAVVERLLAAGYDANQRDEDDQETPLMVAARMGQPKMVALLLAHGADPSARTEDGETARDTVLAYLGSEPQRNHPPYLAILNLLDAHSGEAEPGAG